MALPAGDLCLQVDLDIEALANLSIDFIGGLKLSVQLEPGDFPTAANVVANLLGQANAALAPLAPIFQILDVIMSIVDVLKAIPDSLGPPPDPSAVVKALAKLAKKVAVLVKLLPPVSIPALIKSLLNVLIVGLQGLREQLVAQIAAEARIDAGQAKIDALMALPGGAGLEIAAALQINLDCANANVQAAAAANLATAGPLNRLIGVINIVAGLAGLGSIGTLSFAGNAEATLAPLDASIHALGVVKDAIPLP